jgi:hypothetical protein
MLRQIWIAFKSLFASKTAGKTPARTEPASKATAAAAKAASPASVRPAAHGTRDLLPLGGSSPSRGFSRPKPPPPVRNYGPQTARMRGFDRAHGAQLRIKRYTRPR